MRKIASFGIGLPASLFCSPIASEYTNLPLRATRNTAPGSLPWSISFLKVSAMRPSFCADMPTDSAGAAGRPCAQAVAKVKSVTERTAAERVAVVLHLALIYVFLDRECRVAGRYVGRRDGVNVASPADVSALAIYAASQHKLKPAFLPQSTQSTQRTQRTQRKNQTILTSRTVPLPANRPGRKDSAFSHP